ncbi:MAG TPA: flagellar hook-basal body complex protein FliE [Armatimonadota bacterium]|jgi:flagellar hook-basal body complex protein FliE
MLIASIGNSAGTWMQAAPLPSVSSGGNSLPAWERPAPQADFGQYLTNALDQVNSLHLDADKQAQMVATGQSADLNAAVMAVDKAALALQLTVAVTNRAIEAYKEVSRMQM